MFDQEAIDAFNLSKKQEAERQQALGAVDRVSSKVDSVKKAIDFSTAKLISDRKVNPQNVRVLNDLASPDDIQKVVSGLDNLAVVLKPEANDDGPVIEAINSLREQLIKLPSEMPEVESVEEVTVKNLDSFKGYIKPLLDAINKLELSPTFDPKIEVKPADVKITTEKVDLSVIETLLREKEDEEGAVNFSDYHAQDMDNSSSGVQYVGLEALDGRWCFIENDVEADSMRFVFGPSGYSEEWKNHISRPYKTLSEAYNAAQA